MSQSKDISTALLKAFETMNKNNATQAQTSNVIECAISAVVDNAAGIYTVQYQNSSFNVYSNSTVRYSVKDTVYVLIPGNDMSKKKIILGLVDSNKEEAKSSDDGDTSRYLIIADNILAINPNDVLNLNSYHSPESKIFFSGNTDSSDQATMPEYLKTYKTYGLTMKVKTELLKEQQVAGNYGIKLTLPFYRLNEQGEKMINDREFIFDIHKMLGNPYNFQNYTSQSYFFTLEEEKNIFYDTRRSPVITGFVENFGSDYESEIDDIFIKDIKFVVAKELSQEEMNGNYLTIKSNNGNYFLKNYYETKKTLTPVLKIKGALKDVQGYDCYWFVKDNSIDSNSEYYSEKGGRGWKCLNTKTKVESNNNSDESFQFVTNEYNLNIDIKDVKTSSLYKCVILYNDEKISGTVEIVNLNSNIKLTLRSTTGDTHFVKDIGYVTLVEDIYYPSITDSYNSNVTFEYYWNRYDKNGNFLDSDFFEYDGIINTPQDGHYLTNIKFPTAKMQDANTIECTIQMIISNGDGTKIKETLGVSTIVVFAVDTKDFSTYLRNHIRLYNYDSDGDSPFSKYYDKSIKGLEKIEPLSFKIYKADGTELNETEYKAVEVVWAVPKNSLLIIDKTLISNEDDDYYYVFGERNLPYDIASVYSATKSDNTIILNTKFSGCQMQTYTNFTFIKDGGSGTNGTNFAAEIVVDGYAYGTPHSHFHYPCKLQYIYIGEEKQWYLYDMQNDCLTKDLNMLSLDVNVYSQGVIITDESLYKVEWSIFDDKATNPCFKIKDKQLVPIVTDFNTREVYCTIIQAKITVTDTSTAKADWEIYAYYPIEITYVNEKKTIVVLDGDNVEKVILPTLNGGFTEVVYASDGTNPSYDNTEHFVIKDSLYNIDSKDIYYYEWETSKNLIIQKNKDLDINTKQIRPIAKFDSGESKNYIKTTIMLNPDLKTTIQDTKSKIETEITNLIEQDECLSYYKKSLEKALAYFDYDKYINILQTIDEYPKLRTDIIDTIGKIKTSLKEFYNYYEEHQILIKPSFQFDNIKYNEYLEYIKMDEMYFLTSIEIPTEESNIKKIELEETQLDKLQKDCENTNNIIIYNTFIEYLTKYNNDVTSFYNIRNKIMIQNPDTGEYQYKDTEELLNNLFYSDEVGKVNGIFTLYASVSNFEKMAQPYIEFASYIDERFISDVRNVSTALDEIRRSTSISEYKRYLDDIKAIYSRWGVYNDGVMKLSEAAEKDLGGRIADVKNKLNQKQNEYSDYVALSNIKIDNIIHIKPILMLYNRYELSNVNAWDGNKIYTGDDDEFLLAPQVGAGRKNSDNSFTGMIMGIRNLNSSHNRANSAQVGLFGYSGGKRSMFLNADDGSAIFGVHKQGQIIIDPSTDKALLFSGAFYKDEVYGPDGKPTNYNKSNESGKGMLIDLTTPEIRYGNGNFAVNTEGHLTAKGGGSIAGWEIGDTSLSKGNVLISSDNSSSNNIAFKAGDNFSVTHGGSLIAKDGNIAGWTINADGFTKGKSGWSDDINAGVYIGTKGLYLGNGKQGEAETQYFYVYGPDNEDPSKIGKLVAMSADIRGKIQADEGKIGDYTISEGHISTNGKTWDNQDEDGNFIQGVYIGKEGIFLGQNFWVDAETGTLHATGATIDGNVTANSIDLNTATISGTLSLNNIDCQGVVNASTLDADNITTGTLGAERIDCDSVIANAATIGGWEINTDSLSKTITTDVQWGTGDDTKTITSTVQLFISSNNAGVSCSGQRVVDSDPSSPETANDILEDYTIKLDTEHGLYMRAEENGKSRYSGSVVPIELTIGEKTYKVLCVR